VKQLDWGAVLKTARKREGLTQDELADKLHLTKSCISKFEHNVKEAKISTFINWMKHTNAQDLLIAAMLQIDPGQVTQMLELIGQYVTFIKLF
jgi:transcriptional regulator with XRE-family HTH domain